jgi:Protein of unknown function (DUF2877)
VLIHDVLAKPRRRATVIAAGPAATYLATGDDLVAVVAAGGVRLPCAAVLTGDGPPPAGGDLQIGDGRLWDGDRPVAGVNRWFDPRVRVTDLDPDAVAHLAGRVDARPAPDPAVPAAAVDDLAADPAGAVDDLVGRGGGLTPAGDDLLAGCLAALRARRSPEAGALGAAVRRRARGRTTRLSAALLAAADHGAVVPEAAAVVRALAARPGPDLDRAADRLLALGHTSGWYLAAGLAVGCAA